MVRRDVVDDRQISSGEIGPDLVEFLAKSAEGASVKRCLGRVQSDQDAVTQVAELTR
jgi:hypothetical protein